LVVMLAHMPAIGEETTPLADCRSRFAEQIEKIETTHADAHVGVLSSYTNSLVALRTRAQAAGNLDEVKSVLAEEKRFAKYRTLPEDPAPFAALQRVAFKHVQASQQVDEATARAVVTLASQYDRALAALQKKLTRTGDLVEATAVQHNQRLSRAFRHSS